MFGKTTHVKTPATTPADPIPDTARPTTKAVEVGATAESKDPSSKMKRAVIKTALIEKTVYILPNMN